MFVFVIKADTILLFMKRWANWYSQRTSVLEVAGTVPAPVIVELL